MATLLTSSYFPKGCVCRCVGRLFVVICLYGVYARCTPFIVVYCLLLLMQMAAGARAPTGEPTRFEYSLTTVGLCLTVSLLSTGAVSV